MRTDDWTALTSRLADCSFSETLTRSLCAPQTAVGRRQPCTLLVSAKFERFQPQDYGVTTVVSKSMLLSAYHK